MKLSIITCTYNSEKYLQETIKSILNQKLEKNTFEHIFIDGNSSDNTKNIIENYKNSNQDNNIKLIVKKPNGIYNAMNEGIKISNGEYLLFLHSDDYLQPNILNNYLKFIEETGNQNLYYAKFNAVDENGKFIYNAPIRKIYQQGLKKWIFGLICYINQPAVLHKRSLHKKYGLFNEKLKIIADREFWIILAKNKIKGLFYDKTVTNFRIHENGASNSSKISKLLKDERKYLWDKYFGIEKYLFYYILKFYHFIKRN